MFLSVATILVNAGGWHDDFGDINVDQNGGHHKNKKNARTEWFKKWEKRELLVGMCLDSGAVRMFENSSGL